MASIRTRPVKTVLVADDTAFVRERFRTAIEQAGHRAVEARTGVQLLAILQRDDPRIDLVLLDLHLSGGRGLELLRRVRDIVQERPILVFSGTIANAHEVAELGSAGVTGYINEYIGTQNLVRALVPHLFPDEHNRRSSPRVGLSVQVSYRVGNTIATAVSLNMSTGGLAVRTTNPLEVGSTLKVRFRLPRGGHEIEATARVAWANSRLGMGLQFTAVDPPHQAALDAHVSAHFFSNRKA
jgi:uncharacterized protein (TIGR02266 family)